MQDGAISLRLPLDGFVPPGLPQGLRFAPFGEADAGAVEDLLVHVRADGLAGPPSDKFGWFERVARDPKWDASLVILVRDCADGALVGVAHCWLGAYLKNLGVAESHRGRGIAPALVGEAARQWRARGALFLDLKVRAGNAPARRLYARLGFHPHTD